MPLTVDERLAILEAENAKLRQAVRSRIRLGKTPKGAVALYGLRRFPVALYKEEWLTVDANMPDIKAFISEHDSELPAKGETVEDLAG